jgi:hypothetical protein
MELVITSSQLEKNCKNKFAENSVFTLLVRSIPFRYHAQTE